MCVCVHTWKTDPQTETENWFNKTLLCDEQRNVDQTRSQPQSESGAWWGKLNWTFVSNLQLERQDKTPSSGCLFPRVQNVEQNSPKFLFVDILEFGPFWGTLGYIKSLSCFPLNTKVVLFLANNVRCTPW
jgi:hypothetical protein